jgi:hypothetical protein
MSTREEELTTEEILEMMNHVNLNGEDVAELLGEDISGCCCDDEDAEQVLGEILEFTPMGWKCPSCKRVNAPFVSQCPCSPPPPPFTPWPPPFPTVPVPNLWVPLHPPTTPYWGSYTVNLCSGEHA